MNNFEVVQNLNITFSKVKFIVLNQKMMLTAIAYAGFSKGGGGDRKFRKFEINEDQNENFPA